MDGTNGKRRRPNGLRSRTEPGEWHGLRDTPPVVSRETAPMQMPRNASRRVEGSALVPTEAFCWQTTDQPMSLGNVVDRLKVSNSITPREVGIWAVGLRSKSLLVSSMVPSDRNDKLDDHTFSATCFPACATEAALVERAGIPQ